MDLIPMDTIHARRIRILKKAEETLDNHVDSRDNSAIPEFLANVEDVNDRAYLFQSAVLKLTCNNDWDTLGAVLKYGESDKENLDVQWIKVEEDNATTREVPCMKKEGRRNPLIVASEQGYLQCTKWLYSFGYRIPQVQSATEPGLAGEQEEFRSDLVIWNQAKDDQVSKFLAMQAYAKPHYLTLGLTEDDRVNGDIDDEEDIQDLEKLDPLRRSLRIAGKAESLNSTAGRASNLNCDYLGIQEELDKFSSSVLTQCKSMDEVEVLLEHRPANNRTGPTAPTWKQSNLKKALWEARKDFVAHPYYQEYFHKQMIGATSHQIDPDSQHRVFWRCFYFPYVLFIFCCYPFVVFADFFRNADILFVKEKDKNHSGTNGTVDEEKVDRSSGENSFFAFFRREMHTPNFRMTIHVTVQVLYLTLLLLMIWNPTEEEIHKEKMKSLFLYYIVLVVTAIFLLEGTIDFFMSLREKEKAEFFESIWNVWNIFFRLVLFIGLFIHIFSPKRREMEGQMVFESGNDEINVSLTLVCLGVSAEFFKSLRLLLLFKSFGPLVICVINVIGDALKTIPIYFVIFSSYGIFMWGMFRPFHQAFKNDKAQGTTILTDTFDLEENEAAKSRDGLFHALFWKVLYGGNQAEIQLKHADGTASHEFSHNFILVAWALYQFTIYLLMLNLVIAIMNNTFSDVWQKADRNWKYSKSYYQAQFLHEKATLPSPFQWIYFLAYLVRKCKNCGGKMERTERHAEQSEKRKGYLKLLKKLLDIKLRNEFENTREDKLADLRRDIQLDLKAMKEQLIAEMAGK